jgi:hypothetical protein
MARRRKKARRRSVKRWLTELLNKLEKRKKGGFMPGGGRPKGSLNKVTTTLREAILLAADQAHPDGIVGYLRTQAADNPNAFMSLLGRVVPLQVASDGGAIVIEIVRFGPLIDGEAGHE